MKNFTYYQPQTLQQAVALLNNRWGTSELLAGGTDLHDLQKEYVAQPDKVVSLSGIGAKDEFNQITVDAAAKLVTIGAGVKLSAIAAHAVVRQQFPALAEAAGQVGGPQIQNMGSLGGNLCQRNRCWYFRDEHVNCLLKGGQRCFALDGANQYHAVFSQGHRCVIVHPSTLAPALIALGATAKVLGPRGNRTIELARFFQAPSTANQREHVLEPNEVVVSVSIPNRGLRNASYEVRHKQSYDWPLVQAAAAFELQGTRATNVRIVLGHVAPTPHLAEAAARSLEGKDVNDANANAAGRAATEGNRPLSQNGYKVRLIEVAVKRAIFSAAGQNRYWEL